MEKPSNINTYKATGKWNMQKNGETGHDYLVVSRFPCPKTERNTAI